MSEEYYYNLETGAVELGKQSGWRNRIGPYATYQDAQNALQRAAARNKEWEDEDKREREADGKDDW